jgi:hypothetical protein
MATTLYPLSWFPSFAKNSAEADPYHTACLVTVDLDPEDAELSVVEVDLDEALAAIAAAGQRSPGLDEVQTDVFSDRFFVVSGADGRYCRLVHGPLDRLYARV